MDALSPLDVDVLISLPGPLDCGGALPIDMAEDFLPGNKKGLDKIVASLAKIKTFLFTNTGNMGSFKEHKDSGMSYDYRYTYSLSAAAFKWVYETYSEWGRTSKQEAEERPKPEKSELLTC